MQRTQAIWSIHPEVLATDLGDELVLMHPARSEMFSLNAAGRLLWARLPATLDELAEVLVKTYGLPLAQASADAESVLTELRARDLVQQP